LEKNSGFSPGACATPNQRPRDRLTLLATLSAAVVISASHLSATNHEALMSDARLSLAILLLNRPIGNKRSFDGPARHIYLLFQAPSLPVFIPRIGRLSVFGKSLAYPGADRPLPI